MITSIAMYIKYLCVNLISAVILDLIFGDPHFLYHPVQAMGGLVTFFEKNTRRLLGIEDNSLVDDKKWEKRLAGALTAIGTILISTSFFGALMFAAYRINTILFYVFSAFVSYQMIAARSLFDESMKVCRVLPVEFEDIDERLLDERLMDARQKLSMIVGRDTQKLDEEGIIKACVETVAENTSDGVIAPLLFIAFLGPVGGVLYKSVNTLDSMIGYKNDKYMYFGTCAARLDDIFNFIPSRISALLMIISSAFLPFASLKGAVKIFLRDRYNHKSPNSAQTESVAAGALRIRLSGPSSYFGKVVPKPYIGDDLRPICRRDVLRTNVLMLFSEGIIILSAIAVLFIYK